MGPYAIFSCERCGREYRSQPAFKERVVDDVKRKAFGGFLRNLPVVGDMVGEENVNERHRTNMTPDELNAAWEQTQKYFRECPTCLEIVCIPDFDEASGYCDDDSPRRAQVEQAKGEQAAGFMKGMADVFGVSGALRKAVEQAQSAAPSVATCPNCSAVSPVDTAFCPNCGTAMPPPPAPTAAAVACTNCGSQVPADQKFCANCGTPVAPKPVGCPNCGAEAAGAFCGNCGSKLT